MAVTTMKLVTIVGLMPHLDDVMQVCGESGLFHPEDALTFFSDTKDFSAVREENPYTEPLNRLKGAIQRLGGQPEEVRPSPLSEKELLAYIQNFSGRATSAFERISELNGRAQSIIQDIGQFEHLKGLDIELSSILSCKNIKVRFGRLPVESYDKLDLYSDNPYVLFFPGGKEKNYYWGLYFTPLEVADDIDRIFSGLYFERVHVPAATGTVEEILSQLHDEQENVARELEKARADLAAIWEKERDTCLAVYTALYRMEYFFGLRRYAARYHDEFIVAGWVPAYAQEQFDSLLEPIESVSATFEKAEADTRHTPPVKLKNHALFRPFEFLVDMYGVPRYGEMDPTGFVAVTYVLLFGVMFGDVGQGILVAVAGWLMWKLRKMAIGRILVPCGISSAVFGVVYGSVFGFEHLLDPFYKAVFGLDEKPIEIMSSTTAILLASVAAGLVLIIIAMGINIFSSLRRRDYENALFSSSGVAGFVFYVGLIAGCAGQFLLDIPLLNPVYIVLVLVVPLLAIFFKELLGKLIARDPDWKPESWGEFMVQNFFELFETLLTYLSNTMSFLRVGAFVLVHAGMMLAVFALAKPFGPFGYTVTMILGNALVVVMEATLVAIQVMRLEFYEMFSRYYIGDGQTFSPLSVHTAG